MIENNEELYKAYVFLETRGRLNNLIDERDEKEFRKNSIEKEINQLKFFLNDPSLADSEKKRFESLDSSYSYIRDNLTTSLKGTYINNLQKLMFELETINASLNVLDKKIREEQGFINKLNNPLAEVKEEKVDEVKEEPKEEKKDEEFIPASIATSVKAEAKTMEGIAPEGLGTSDIPEEEDKKKVVFTPVPPMEKPEEVADGMFSKTDDEEDEKIPTFENKEELFAKGLGEEDKDNKDDLFDIALPVSEERTDIGEKEEDEDDLFLAGLPEGYEEATYAQPKPSLFKGDKFKKLLAAAGAALVGLGVFKSPPYHPKGTPTQIEQEADSRTGDVLVQYPTPTPAPTLIPTPTPTVQPTYNPGDIPYDPGYVNPGPTTIEDEIIPEENPEELPPVVEEEIIVDPETGDPINNPENPDNNDEPTVPEDETVTEDIIVDPETGEPIGPTEEPTNPGNDEEPTIPEDDTVTEEIIVDPETGDPIVNPEPVAEPEAPVLDNYESAFDYNTQVEVTHGSETYDEANNTTGSADLEYDNQGLAHTEEVDYQNVLPESAPAVAEEIASAPEAPAYEAPAPETPVYEAPFYEAPAVEAPVAELPQSYDSLVEQAQYDQGAAEVVQAVDEFDWDSLFESEFGDGMSR